MIGLYILGAFVLLICVLLFTPVKYAAEVKLGGQKKIHLRISWLLRLIYINYFSCGDDNETILRVAGIKINKKSKPEKILPSVPVENEIPAAEKPPQIKKTKPKRKKTGGRSGLSFLKALLTYNDAKTIIGLTFDLIKRLFRNLKPDIFFTDLLFGFDDPADTGMLLGLYETAAGIYPIKRNFVLRGDFERSALSMDLKIRGGASAGSFLGPVIWFCTRKPVFKLIKNNLRKEKEVPDGQRKHKQ